MKRPMLTVYATILIASGTLSWNSTATFAQGTDIGMVAAANPRIDGTPPNAEQRILELGMNIFENEFISTSEIGSGQFVFLDQTTLTVSPGSEIVLDKYVFDAASGYGEVALTLSKGVLRFIGGRITKSGEGIVNTPHATIGIRGGIAAITVGNAGTNAVMLAGERMCVAGNTGKAEGVSPCAATKAVIVTRSGGMVRVLSSESESTVATAPDSAGTESGSPVAAATEAPPAESGDPVYVGVATAADVGQIFASADTGGNGGTSQTIEPVVVAAVASASGLSEVGADAPGASQQQPISTEGQEAPQVISEDPVTIVQEDPQAAESALPPEETVEEIPALEDMLPLATPIANTSWTPSIPITHAFTGGYAAGQGQSTLAGSNVTSPYVVRSPDGNGVIIGFDADNNAVVAEFAPLDTFGSPDIFDITLNFGDGSSSETALDDNQFAIGDPFLETGLLTGQNQSISGLNGQDPDINGMQIAMQGAVVSSGLSGDGGIFPVGTNTTPQYLRWGSWSADFQFASDDPGAFESRNEALPSGSWVSGVRSEVSALGTSGEAQFDGLATAHITEIGSSSSVSYVDGGRYLMNFDFGTRTGAATITGIAGTTFVSSISEAGAGSGNHFGGTLLDTSTFSAVGSIDGSFFTGGGDSSAATGGAFDFSRPISDGVTQTGAGVFAADKK